MIGPVKARMTAAALVAALLRVGAASAWAAFVIEGSPYTVGDDPLSLNAGDFNGDGRPDVATINGTSSNVSVFLRQAGGGFAQEAGSPIAVGSGPSGAAVGDYNGDGRADLAVSAFPAGTVSVLLRQAGGGFAHEAGSPISLGTRISSVAAGDFNSDGRLDLAATQNDTDQVVLLLRNPANSGFSPQLQFTTGDRPVAIAVGDYNGDGLADLAIANRDGDSATILVRVPGGGFSSEAAVPVGDDPVGIVAADFDGNGRADLAVPNYVAGTVSAFLRRPSNDSFTAEPPITVSASPAGSPPPTSTATAGPTSPWPLTRAPSTSSAATPAAASRATSRSRSPAPSTASRRPTSTATRGPTWPRRHTPTPPRRTRSPRC